MLFRALIEVIGGEVDEEWVVELLDNGSGADRVEDDGLYSRFFVASVPADSRFMLKCQVSGDDTTHVNGGNIIFN